MAFPHKKQVAEAGQVCQYPSDGYGPPDACHAHSRNGGEDISQQHPGSKGNDGQHYRHAGAFHSPVEAIEQKQAADTEVKGSFNAQILDADGENCCL